MIFKSLIGVLNDAFGKKTSEAAVVAEPQVLKITVNQAILVLDGDGNWTELPKGDYELTPLGPVENDPLDGSPVERDEVWFWLSVGGLVHFVNNLWLQRYAQQFSPFEQKMILEIL